jgi:acyl-CoA oxidase
VLTTPLYFTHLAHYSPLNTMPKKQINFPDLSVPEPSGSEMLERERARATFDSDQLARYIHGKQDLERQARLLTILENEPLFDKADVYYQGRDAKFRASMAKAKRMVQVGGLRISSANWQIAKENNWDEDDLMMAIYLLDESGPVSLVNRVSQPDLVSFASRHVSDHAAGTNYRNPEEEIPGAGRVCHRSSRVLIIRAYVHIGCYAQTELGHGTSSIRALA